MRLLRLISTIPGLLRLSGVRIEMSGDEHCRYLYAVFTRRHPRWRLIQNKRWGVALLALPEHADDYPRLASRGLRRRVRHATNAGFSFERIQPLDRLEEVLSIHRSAAVRQGRPMHSDYFDIAAVRQNLERAEHVYGVSNAAGELRAYLTVRNCGEVACMERLIGHADSLEEGIMYLLIEGTVRHLIADRGPGGRPTWMYYDTFPGASDGMRTFKHVTGFRPYRVSWSWRD